jgi:hypothetical protein
VVADVTLAAGARALADTAVWLAAHATRTIRLAPARTRTRTRRLHLRVVATDAGGNRRTRTLALTIR